MAFVPQSANDFPTLGWGVIDFLEANICTPQEPDKLITLTDEQARFILRMFELDPSTGERLIRRACLSLPKGYGKALALDTPIPTPDGWSTMAALQVGEQVFGEDGSPVTILGKSEVMTGNDCY